MKRLKPLVPLNSRSKLSSQLNLAHRDILDKLLEVSYFPLVISDIIASYTVPNRLVVVNRYAPSKIVILNDPININTSSESQILKISQNKTIIFDKRRPNRVCALTIDKNGSLWCLTTSYLFTVQIQRKLEWCHKSFPSFITKLPFLSELYKSIVIGDYWYVFIPVLGENKDFNGNQTSIIVLCRYSLTTDTWQRLKETKIIYNRLIALVSMNNYLYLFGHSDIHSPSISCCQRYSIKDNLYISIRAFPQCRTKDPISILMYPSQQLFVIVMFDYIRRSTFWRRYLTVYHYYVNSNQYHHIGESEIITPTVHPPLFIQNHQNKQMSVMIGIHPISTIIIPAHEFDINHQHNSSSSIIITPPGGPPITPPLMSISPFTSSLFHYISTNLVCRQSPDIELDDLYFAII